MNDNSNSEGMYALHEWIKDNQKRITAATLNAMDRVEGASEAMTDLDAVGKEATKQRLDAIIFATPSILPPYMGKAFEQEFSEIGDVLLNALLPAAEEAVKANREEFIDLMIKRFLN